MLFPIPLFLILIPFFRILIFLVRVKIQATSWLRNHCLEWGIINRGLGRWFLHSQPKRKLVSSMVRSSNQIWIHLCMKIGRVAILWFCLEWSIRCMWMYPAVLCTVKLRERCGLSCRISFHMGMALKSTICRSKFHIYARIRCQPLNTTLNSRDLEINCSILSHFQSVRVVLWSCWVLHTTRHMWWDF